MRLVRLSEGDLSRANDATCRPTPLATTNDLANGVVTAEVDIAAAGGSATLVAVFSQRDKASHNYGLLAIYGDANNRGTFATMFTNVSGDPLLVQVTQDWLNEFERVQWILRLSPRLRSLHGD